MNIVISQPMYFPWVGLLEQIKLADIFVFYDDVQFAKGFFNRVQIKTLSGIKWLTVPKKEYHRGQLINEVKLNDGKDWQQQQYDILKQAYSKAPHRDQMLELFKNVLSKPFNSIAELSRLSIIELANYFDLTHTRTFCNSSSLGIPGSSSQRLHDIVRHFGADTYITGQGARNYLDHKLFEDSGVSVKYMQYDCISYPQQHGDFTPYVTALDLIANFGVKGSKVIRSQAINWENYVNDESHQHSSNS